MKKMLILAAVAAAAVLTACGDDDSTSATSYGCTVTSTDNSATASTSLPGGYSSAMTYTITEDGYRITYSGNGAENYDPIDVPSSNPVTKEDLVELAQKSCAME